MKELVGAERCGGSGTTISEVSKVEECGFECARMNGKMIHYYEMDTQRIFCSCLKGCSSNSYSTAAKQYALVTGRVIHLDKTQIKFSNFHLY